METILFTLHTVAVVIVCYMFLVDDKRSRNQPFTSLFRYKLDLSARPVPKDGRGLRGTPARPAPRVFR